MIDVPQGLSGNLIFHGATFADIQRHEGPLILINASDLGYKEAS